MESAARESALDQLKSAEQSKLMDAIDKLRSQGFEKELDLPQLIVCGDQSSGKSSVLEAISQVSFPAGTSTTTRFASELVLRNSPKVSMKAILLPAQSSDIPQEDKELLAQFNPEFNGPADFPSVHEAAVNQLNKLRKQSDFYPHRLRVELSGPSQPHLTLVDLPGLIAIAPEGKEQNISTVRKIMESYMRQPRSIILAVIPATEDPDIKQVLGSARAFDKYGRRTMGILTKPDLIQKGTVQMFIDLVQNQHVNCRLGLGWHVLRNLNSAETSPADRDEVERNFFHDPKGEWYKVSNDLKGVETLRPRLRDILFQNITASLPVLINDMDERIAFWKDGIERLGPSRSEGKDQLRFLGNISSRLSTLIQQAARGTYDDDFFAAGTGDTQEIRRLRNALRKQYDDFFESMKRSGACYSVREQSGHPDDDNQITLRAASEATDVTRSQLLLAIQQHMESHRGLELEGEYSDHTLDQVFKIQCTPWKKIARIAIHECLTTARQFFEIALDYVAPPYTAKAIYSEIAVKKFEIIQGDLNEKLDELLSPFQRLHHFTLDPYFTIERKSLDKIDDQNETELSTAARVHNRVNAYYTISMRKFIDNVVTLAVENCVVERLNDIFAISVVFDIQERDSAMFKKLASEPYETISEREETMRNLATLKEVREICGHSHSKRSRLTYLVEHEPVPAYHPEEENTCHLPNEPLPTTSSINDQNGPRNRTPNSRTPTPIYRFGTPGSVSGSSDKQTELLPEQTQSFAFRAHNPQGFAFGTHNPQDFASGTHTPHRFSSILTQSRPQAERRTTSNGVRSMPIRVLPNEEVLDDEGRIAQGNARTGDKGDDPHEAPKFAVH